MHFLSLFISLNKCLVVGHCANHGNTVTSGESLPSSSEEESQENSEISCHEVTRRMQAPWRQWSLSVSVQQRILTTKTSTWHTADTGQILAER